MTHLNVVKRDSLLSLWFTFSIDNIASQGSHVSQFNVILKHQEFLRWPRVMKESFKTMCSEMT